MTFTPAHGTTTPPAWSSIPGAGLGHVPISTLPSGEPASSVPEFDDLLALALPDSAHR